MKTMLIHSNRGLGLVLTAAVLMTAPTLSGGTLTDDLDFDLEIYAAADGEATSAQLGDRMTHSAATKSSINIYNGACPPVGFQTLEVTPPFHPELTGPQRCLYFPQGMRDVEGKREVAAQCLYYEKAAKRADAGQTAFVRFRWDGPTSADFWSTGLILGFQYSWTATGGWAILMSHNAGSWDKALLGVFTPTKMTDATGVYITTNVWYDLIVSHQPDKTDETKSRVDFYLLKPRVRIPSTTAMPTNQFSLPEPVRCTLTVPRVVYAKDVGQLKFAALDGQTAFKPQTDNCSQSKTFRGAIADVKIWNRALTDDEITEFLGGAHGARWMIGSANGKADEFGAADDATLPEVYDVDTMPSYRLRKELTAAHPSVTLSGAQPARENGAGRYLALTTLLEEVGETCPLTVKANGTVVRTVDLRKEKAIFIPGSHCSADANGKFTLTLERTGDLTGTVKFDALALCGYFQVGKFDGGNGELGHDNYNMMRWYAGDTDDFHFRRAITFCKDVSTSKYQDLTFFVPEGTLDGLRLAFDLKVQDYSPASWLPFDIDVSLNGQKIATYAFTGKPYTMQTYELPPDLLTEGFNTIHLQSDVHAGAKEWGWLIWDALRLRTTRAGHTRGLILTVR